MPYDFSYFDLIRVITLVTSPGTNRWVCKNLKEKGKERKEMRDATVSRAKGRLAMGAGEVPHSTAPLRAAGPQHLVTSHLSAIKCQETPSFIQTTGLNIPLVLKKFLMKKRKHS